MEKLNRYYIIDRYGNLFIKDRKNKTIIDHEETYKYNLSKKNELINKCKELNNKNNI